MHCQKCEKQISENEKSVYRGQILCEDCYIDALSPVRPCDPWAVHNAKSQAGSKALVTTMQKRILDLLVNTGGLELELLAHRLELPMDELEREIATLRHMEKVRAVKVDGGKLFKTW